MSDMVLSRIKFYEALHQDSVDAIKRIDALGGKIPEGYGLELLVDGAWVAASAPDIGEKFCRLVKVPVPIIQPFTREQFEDWFAAGGGQAFVKLPTVKQPHNEPGWARLTMVTETEVFFGGEWFKWTELTNEEISHSFRGPWVPGGIPGMGFK